MTWPSASSRAITRRTVRSLMFALRAIVAADGQHPVPSSREHASASASRTRRSLPDVGELAHTQFITAMLIAFAVPCGERPARSWASDPGSGMGADSIRQVRSDALARAGQRPLTCVDEPEQAACTQARPADKEEVTASGMR